MKANNTQTKALHDPALIRHARLLEKVSRDGYIDDYRGIRISSTGQRFWIEQATVWNIRDEQGRYHGQAAAFAHWTAITDNNS